MLNVVIVGAGLMGRHHLRTARRLGAHIVGVVDRDASAAARLAATAPGAQSATSLLPIIGGKIDVAHVCTPADSHVPIALELAAAGVHTMIEKPLAETTAQTRQLVEAYGKNGVLLCPVHQYAFQRGVEEALGALPVLGPIKRIAFDIASAGGGSVSADFDRIAGEILPHPLAMLQRLAPAMNLAESRWNVIRPEAGEWLLATSHEGLLVTISISLANRPTAFMTRLSGSRGTIEMNNFHGYAAMLPGTVSREAKIAQPFTAASRHLAAASGNLVLRFLRNETAYPGLRALTRQFYCAVASRDESKMPISANQILDLAQARDNILAAVSRQSGG